MVFGAYGEANDAVFNYVRTVARMAAPSWRAHLGAREVDHAYARLVPIITDRLGVLAARAHADLLLRRLERVAGSRGAAVAGGAALTGPPAAARAGDVADGAAAAAPANGWSTEE